MNRNRKKELLRDARNLAATFINREITGYDAQGFLEEFDTSEEKDFVMAELQRIANKLWTSAERINPDSQDEYRTNAS